MRNRRRVTSARRMATAKGAKELAFYYPNPMWYSGDWVKNLILFFDGIALLVPAYMKHRPEEIDPAIVTGLKKHGLLHIIEPEKSVDKGATEKLATALTNIITSGALDHLAKEKTAFHELSMSRLGYYGDESLAKMIFEELKRRNLATDSEDKVSIPLHPMVRSLILVLLAQILRTYGTTMNAELSPATDVPQLVEALSELLIAKPAPSSAAVVSFDLNIVSVDLGPIPIGEVLHFRKENLKAHRRYCLSARKFAQELSRMPEAERKTAFNLRQTELDDIASDLRKKAREAWKKPASFGLTLAGTAIAAAAGHPVAAALTVAAAALRYEGTKAADTGIYSYLFKAQHRFGY
jgi:hypothetical protein